MPTQGSCRPLVTISVSSPVTVMVRRGVRIEEVGLTAKRATRSCPVEMPPRMPPAWFEEKRGLPSSPMKISSAFSVPVGEAMLACVLLDHLLLHRGQVGEAGGRIG